MIDKMIDDNYKRMFIAVLFFTIVSLVVTHPLIFHMHGFLDVKVYNYTKDFFFDGFQVQQIIGDLQNDTISKLIAYRPTGQVAGELPFTYYLEGGLLIMLFNFSGIVAHNLIFIISIILSGLFMYFLTYRFTKNFFASLFAGFLYCTSNAIINLYLWGHPQYWQFQWIPLIFLFLDKVLMDANKLKNSIFLGLLFGIQVLSCFQYTIYLTLMVPLYILLRLSLLNRFFTKKTLPIMLYLGVAVIIGLFVSSWYLVERFQVPPEVRTVEDNSRPDWRLSDIYLLILPSGHYSIGLVPILILMIGVYFILTRRQTEFYSFILLFLVSVLMAVGINPAFPKYAPYYWFFKYWPLASRFRLPGRLMVFVLFSSSLISAAFYTQIMNKFKVKKELIFFIGMMILIIVGCKIFSPSITQHIINYSGHSYAGGNWSLSAVAP